ncbi:helicase associated domain-containing protein [Oerskovia sp. Sa1BUA8]|uniref:Helicase associated domain-containing protein n=1 Tax=Oerskovia douganii TaxID=2762210 RepID=A0A9D5UCU0_9CELL|nr:helicase associated domain-containing protein [Oerskovia douganii]MBE7702343.1 helicase associated domain-containing protein [Oerskovia douganii]
MGRYEDRWWQGHDHLLRFVAAHGHSRVPVGHRTVPDGFTLGTWVKVQRREHALGTLKDERFRALSEAGFEFEVRRPVKEWQRNVGRLAAFRDEHGHTRVPYYFETADGFGLGTWVGRMRRRRAAGDLTDQQVADLEAAGMDWTAPLTVSKGRSHRAFAEFVAEHGHGQVPDAYRTSDGFDLSGWVARVRREQRAGRLSPAQEDELRDLGLDLPRVPDAQDWDAHLACLTRYVARNGPGISTTFECDDGTRLGHWVASQRAARRAGELSQDRITQLDGIGFVWHVPDGDGRWRRGVELLTRYVEEHGHARVPGDHVAPDGTRLGAWVARRRWEHRHGLLRAERIDQLEALGFEWVASPRAGASRGTDDEAFRAWVGALEAFRAEHEHCRVPAAYRSPDGRRLGAWVAYTRARHAKGLLEPGRVEVLDRVGFVWRVRDNDQLWRQGVDALTRYVEVHGHARVPIRYRCDDGFRLGRWVRSRRSEGVTGRLSPERTAALDALGFVWDPLALAA